MPKKTKKRKRATRKRGATTDLLLKELKSNQLALVQIVHTTRDNVARLVELTELIRSAAERVPPFAVVSATGRLELPEEKGKVWQVKRALPEKGLGGEFAPEWATDADVQAFLRQKALAHAPLVTIGAVANFSTPVGGTEQRCYLTPWRPVRLEKISLQSNCAAVIAQVQIDGVNYLPSASTPSAGVLELPLNNLVGAADQIEVAIRVLRA